MAKPKRTAKEQLEAERKRFRARQKPKPKLAKQPKSQKKLCSEKPASQRNA
jgi:hypothetical protein